MKQFCLVGLALFLFNRCLAGGGDSTLLRNTFEFTLSGGIVASPRTLELNFIPSLHYRFGKTYIGVSYSYPLKQKYKYFETYSPRFKSDTGQGTNEQFVRLDAGRIFWINHKNTRQYSFQVGLMYLWGNISYDDIPNPATGYDVVRHKAIGVLGGLVEERKLGKKIWLKTQLLGGGRNVYSSNSKSHSFYHGYFSTGLAYRF